MRYIGWFFGLFVGFSVLGMAVNILGMGFQFAWLPFHKAQAQLNMTEQTQNIVYDAQRCIDVNASYQTFKTQVPAIRDEQIPNAQTALDTFEKKLPTDQTKWSVQQQQMDGELQTNITGLQQQMSQLQAQYAAFTVRNDIQPCLGKVPVFFDLKPY